MNSDQTWLEDLLKLQRQMVEIVLNNKNLNKDTINLMRHALKHWGIPDFPWAKDIESFSLFWDQKNQNSMDELSPDINITETKNEVIITAAIPGIVDQNNFSIRLRGDVLSIETKVNQSNSDKPYSRRIRLPAKVTVVDAKAIYQDGTLLVRLPKMTEQEENIPISIINI